MEKCGERCVKVCWGEREVKGDVGRGRGGREGVGSMLGCGGRYEGVVGVLKCGERCWEVCWGVG